MNYYEVLDVNKNSSSQDIKKQYKKLALKHHPDRGGDPEQFKKISEAYQILSDPQKRGEYDNPSPFVRNMPSGRSRPPGFVDPEPVRTPRCARHPWLRGFGEQDCRSPWGQRHAWFPGDSSCRRPEHRSAKAGRHQSRWPGLVVTRVR